LKLTKFNARSNSIEAAMLLENLRDNIGRSSNVRRHAVAFATAYTAPARTGTPSIPVPIKPTVNYRQAALPAKERNAAAASRGYYFAGAGAGAPGAPGAPATPFSGVGAD
jgi:hypothetical protein